MQELIGPTTVGNLTLIDRRVTYNELKWPFYIIETLDRNIGAWNDSITLQTLPGINIGVQYIRYTIEYIPKLQLHQHFLLTGKVFSQHNLLAQLFFSASSGSSSSSHHLHLQVIIWIWIITRYGSSSLDLDHHSIWIIIIGSGSSLDLDLEHH